MRTRKIFYRILMFLLTIPVLLFIFLPILWLFSALRNSSISRDVAMS